MRQLLQRWAFLLTAGVSVALAAPAGFVVRVEGERIVINRGTMDSVKTGDRFTIVRQGRQIAEVEVNNVNAQDSHAKVLRLLGQEPVLAGDAISRGGEVMPVAGAATGPAPVKKLTPLQLTMQESQEAYESLLKGRTHSQEFEQKWSGRSGTTSNLNEYTMTNILDSLGYGLLGGGGGWWNATDQLLRTANMAFLNHHIHDRMTKDHVARIELEVVHWDDELLEAYCRMQAAQAGMSTVEELSALRSQMQREKALDQNDVFQVRIKNNGELNVELAPFHWHMFLSAPDDKRVVSTRYDQVLDRKLSPKQEVVGYITFPKVPGRENLTVYFEDIYGDKGEVTFSR